MTDARYVAYADTADYSKNFGGLLAQVSTPEVFGDGSSFRV